MTETLRIKNPEGQELLADVYSPGDRIKASIIGIYGFTSERDDDKYVRLGKTFEENGYRAIIFDRRGHGESGGDPADDMLSAAIEDVKTVVDYFKEVDETEEIRGAFGSSFGGTVAIHFSVKYPEELDALVLRSPGTYFDREYSEYKKEFPRILREKRGLSSEEIDRFMEDYNSYDMRSAARKLKLPTLILHGNKDNKVPFKASEEFKNDLETEKDWEEFDGQGHEFSEEAKEKALEMAVDWFEKKLG